MVGDPQKKSQFTDDPRFPHTDIIYDTLHFPTVHTFTACYKDPATNEWKDLHWDDPKPGHPIAYCHRFYKDYSGSAHVGYSTIESFYLHDEQLAPIISIWGEDVEELLFAKTEYKYSCVVKVLNEQLRTAHPCNHQEIEDSTIYSNFLNRVL